jgi:hypothetical protein
MRLWIALLFGILPSVAHAGESTPVECSDGVDNDGNGYVDCDDMKCKGVGKCPALIIESTGEEKLTPRAQIIAGSIMLILGPALSGSSAVVFLDAADQKISSKRIVEYVIGGVMSAAGLAIAISGATLVRKGVRRHREDVEMGLTVSAAKLGYYVTF